jgi:hypothetical protein
VIKTLQLPLHFQIFLGRRPVAKVDATRGFAVRHRQYADFRFAVPRVDHTRRAFIKYLLHRFKVFLRSRLPKAIALVSERFPLTYGPVLLPTPSSIYAVYCLLWLFLSWWLGVLTDFTIAILAEGDIWHFRPRPVVPETVVQYVSVEQKRPPVVQVVVRCDACADEMVHWRPVDWSAEEE